MKVLFIGLWSRKDMVQPTQPDPFHSSSYFDPIQQNLRAYVSIYASVLKTLLSVIFADVANLNTGVIRTQVAAVMVATDGIHHRTDRSTLFVRWRQSQCERPSNIWFTVPTRLLSQTASLSAQLFLHSSHSWQYRHTEKPRHSVRSKRPHLCYARDAA